MVKEPGETLLTMRRLAVATLSLLCGGTIYLLFRPTSLLMFDWIDRIGIKQPISSARDAAGPYAHLAHSCLLNSLPDALWLLSLMVMIDLVWEGFPRTSLPLLCATVVVSISIECAQARWPRLGTFDWCDVVALCGVASIYLYSSARQAHKGEDPKCTVIKNGF